MDVLLGGRVARAHSLQPARQPAGALGQLGVIEVRYDRPWPAGWLVRALTAAGAAVPDPTKANIAAVLKRADAAKDDAERLAVLRAFVAKLAAGR